MRRRKGRRRNTTKKRTRRKRSLECHKTRRYRRRYRSASKKGPNSKLSKVGRAQEGASATERGPAGGGGGGAGAEGFSPRNGKAKPKRGKEFAFLLESQHSADTQCHSCESEGERVGAARPGPAAHRRHCILTVGAATGLPLPSLFQNAPLVMCVGGGGARGWGGGGGGGARGVGGPKKKKS
jgi:hypothetical protein